ncbi:MAG: DegT/DnrJ/EryC1/StrS family aminotransferase [Calditerrivibrio sp.]|nr:DegT/DnrJ/EryC1/StrS family aminotransferase [Calditerrivibrio sp.]
MIPVNEPLFGEKEKEYLIRCIETGWIGSDGQFVKEFEEKFASYIGRKYGVAVSSGTAALEVAVKAVGISSEDEVIMPTFTIISCAQAIVKVGAKPVLVDADYRTFNMIVNDIEKKITEKTKAIMIVHIYGLPVDVEPVRNLAKKYGLLIIEDSAEAIGLEYKEKLCGSFGDVSVFSFYTNKHIATGEGGMILTDDEEIAEKCKYYRNLCFSKDPALRFVHEDIGWNYRMTNLQAAVGLAQIERISDIIQKKRWIGRKYNELLSDIPHIYLPVEKTDYAENIYWVYPIVIKDEYKKDAKEVMKALRQMGIDTRPFFYPMHKQPVFNRMGLFLGEHYPNSEKLYEKGFYIPSGIALTEEQILKVSEAMHEVFK